MKNGNVTKEFAITNPTDKDILVTTLETSCMCTKAFMVEPDGTSKGPFGMRSMGYAWPVNETIKVGENRIVRVVYDPNAHGPAGVGRIDRFIILTEDSGSIIPPSINPPKLQVMKASLYDGSLIHLTILTQKGPLTVPG